MEKRPEDYYYKCSCGWEGYGHDAFVEYDNSEFDFEFMGVPGKAGGPYVIIICPNCGDELEDIRGEL